jgi:hypothetical protein
MDLLRLGLSEIFPNNPVSLIHYDQLINIYIVFKNTFQCSSILASKILLGYAIVMESKMKNMCVFQIIFIRLRLVKAINTLFSQYGYNFMPQHCTTTRTVISAAVSGNPNMITYGNHINVTKTFVNSNIGVEKKNTSVI